MTLRALPVAALLVVAFGLPARAPDDSGWPTVAPAMLAVGVPPDWTGGGGFRSHLLVEPRLEGATIAPGFEAQGADPPWRTGLRGAIVALPVFVLCLHLALFAFDPRGRENLFYAAEMAAFALILLREYGEDLLASPAQREALDFLLQGVPVLAILFGLLTYYAVRTRPYPRSWRLFVGAGLLLVVTSFAWPAVAGHAWIPYFAGVVVEVLRIERAGRTMERSGAGIFLWSFAALGAAIVLQVLVVLNVFESVGGTRAVYGFGVIASATGMSLYLARSFGEARVAEAENERKGHELARARELQLSLLPRVLPEVPGLDVAAATHTATEVGGDFYDAREEAGGTLLVAFGDATGHGLASGALVTAAKALFTALPDGAPLAEGVAGFSRVFAAMELPRLRMCLALARISPHEAAIVSAAMPPLLVHRAATDTVEELGAGGLPLGSRLAGAYEERRTPLEPGDTLLFASDGFAELRTSGSGELGYEEAARAFGRAVRPAVAREVVEALGEALATARGGRPLEDDVTFVVVRLSGAGAGTDPTARSGS